MLCPFCAPLPPPPWPGTCCLHPWLQKWVLSIHWDLSRAGNLWMPLCAAVAVAQLTGRSIALGRCLFHDSSETWCWRLVPFLCAAFLVEYTWLLGSCAGLVKSHLYGTWKPSSFLSLVGRDSNCHLPGNCHLQSEGAVSDFYRKTCNTSSAKTRLIHSKECWILEYGEKAQKETGVRPCG